MYEHSATVTVLFAFFVALATVRVCACCPNGHFNNSMLCIQCPLYCAFCNSSEFCFECIAGFSGQRCQFYCSNCKHGTECDQDSGFCKEGCKDGFSGSWCEDVCDSKCQSCDRYKPTKCVTCKTNQTCEEMCPGNCLSKKCTENKCNGGCRSGYWGDSCDKKCPLTCSNDVCDRDNGTCPEDKCSQGECDKRNGTRTEAADELLLFNTLHLIVAILSVLLVMMTGVVIYLICRQRIHRSTAGNSPEEMTVRTIDLQTFPADSYAYHLPSERHDIVYQPSEENIASYLSPVHIVEDQNYQYGGIGTNDYTPFSTTEHSDNQYNQITMAASAAPMSK